MGSTASWSATWGLLSSSSEERKTWTGGIQMLLGHWIDRVSDGRVWTVKVKYFNSPSKKPKFVITYVRKLTLIPTISDPNWDQILY